LWRVPVNTEKKPDEQKKDQPKHDLGEIVGNLVVSGAVLLAHSAAETVIKRVKKAAEKLAPVEAVTLKGVQSYLPPLPKQRV
jgi:hypothetical protein